MSLTLSDKQSDVITFAARPETTLLTGGAVRSGKSFSVMMSFALWLISQKTKNDHAVVGQSIESIMRNMGFDFIDTVNRMPGCSAHFDRTYGTRIVVFGKSEQYVWIIGANDLRARKRIQGSTLKGLVVEELTLLPKDFFWMAWSRLSVDGAKMWASYNPEGPSHWVKKEVVDQPESFDGREIKFCMRDNPTLSEKVIERYEKSFTGHFRRRLIEGQWAAASGACYPMWELTDKDLPEGKSMPNVHLAIDWAVSGTLAVLLITRKRRKAVVADEFYHEGRTEGLLTEIQVADKIHAWWGQKKLKAVVYAWVDPTTPSTFKRLLRERGFTVRNADNSVVPGIVTTAKRLSIGEIKIHKRCKNLQTELAGYVWDDAAAEKGEDKPIKSSDHGCDALRYFAHSTGKAYHAMVETKVREALQWVQ